jgi:rod shape-determining protein MreD
MGFSVLIFIAVVLQAMVLPRIGAVPTPMIALAAVVSAAALSSPAGGAAAGFVCGMVCDALLGTEAFYSLTMMGAGAAAGTLCGRVLQRAFLPVMVLSAAAAVIIESSYFFIFQIAVRRTPLSAYAGVSLPVIAASILCVPLVYPFFRAAAKRFSED